MTSQKDQARLDFLTALKRAGYHFVTPTPATHRRYLRRRGEAALGRGLRDVFGWNLAFEPAVLGDGLLDLAWAAGVIERAGDRLRATHRVASLADDLFLHAPFPAPADGVFFGPDSYRFARFLEARLEGAEAGASLLDVGAGSGVGAVAASRHLRPSRLVLTDSNPAALALARVNLAAAGIQPAALALGDGLSAVDEAFDIIIANPPFMANAKGRLYSDGGDALGAEISINWSLQAARRLRPGGRLLLYSGSAIVDGRDALREALERLLSRGDVTLDYAELDPDIFGGALASETYKDVERIAAVGAVIGYKRAAGG